MKKDEFLNKLRKKLVVLTDEEIEDIIEEYGGYIDEKVKKGKKTEEEAIGEFGDIDELSREILSAYKVKPDTDIAKSFIMNLFNDIAKTFEKIVDDLSDKEPTEVMKFVFEMLLLILLIAICRIPVHIIINIGREIFMIMPMPLYALIYGIWRLLFEIGYLLLAVLFFIKIFKIRYANYNFKQSPVKTPPKKKKVVKEEKEIEKVEEKVKDDVHRVKKEENFDGLLIVFRIIVAFFLMPAVASLMGLVIAFTLGIALVISGVHYFGFLIILFAKMQFSIFFVEMMFRFVFALKIKARRLFVSLIIGIILTGVGVSIAMFEVLNTTYINAPPSDQQKTQITSLYDANEIDNIWNWRRIEYIVDEREDNTITVVVKHFENFTTPKLEIHNRSLEIRNDYRNIVIAPRDMFNLVVRNLRNKRIYNYSELYQFEIRVYANEETINRLRNYE